VRLIVASILIIAAGIQSGCGEPSQNVTYEGGKYAGKPDAPAWQSDTFNGSRDDWEVEIKKRGKLQSEYTRLKGGT
jgi:hypothetical protein